MNGEDARQPEWGFEMRTQSDTDRPTTEPRTARAVLRDHLSKYPALESSMRLIDEQLDAIEAEAAQGAAPRAKIPGIDRPRRFTGDNG